jgi:hypothetical protein
MRLLLEAVVLGRLPPGAVNLESWTRRIPA